MTGSAAHAVRLATWGSLLLVGPFVALLALLGILIVDPVRVLTPLVGVVTLVWGGVLLTTWLAVRHLPPEPLDQEDAPGAVAVAPEEQPDLWGLVHEAASLTGVQPPDEVRLTAVGAISAWPGERSHLDIGVPLLFVLDAPAVGALIARALANAESGWAEAAEPVERFRAFAGVLASRRLTREPARTLHRRVSALRSEALLAADDVAALVGGPRTAARAMGWAHVVRAGSRWWHEEFVAPGLTRGMAPRPLLVGLESLLGDPTRRTALARAAETLLPAGDGSGVPGFAERVHSLRVGADAPPEEVGSPTSELLRAPSSILERIGETAARTATRDLTWPLALESWAARTSHSCAVLLSGCTGSVRPLEDVLGGVGEGRLPDWVRELVRDPAADTTELGTFLLTGLLVAALVDGGAGRMSATWGGEIDVVQPDGTTLEVSRAARLLVEDPTLAPTLRDLVVDLGASPDFVPAAEGGGAALPLHAFLREAGRRRIPGTGFPGVTPPS